MLVDLGDVEPREFRLDRGVFGSDGVVPARVPFDGERGDGPIPALRLPVFLEPVEGVDADAHVQQVAFSVVHAVQGARLTHHWSSVCALSLSTVDSTACGLVEVTVAATHRGT